MYRSTPYSEEYYFVSLAFMSGLIFQLLTLPEYNLPHNLFNTRTQKSDDCKLMVVK